MWEELWQIATSGKQPWQWLLKALITEGVDTMIYVEHVMADSPMITSLLPNKNFIKQLYGEAHLYWCLIWECNRQLEGRGYGDKVKVVQVNTYYVVLTLMPPIPPTLRSLVNKLRDQGVESSLIRELEWAIAKHIKGGEWE